MHVNYSYLQHQRTVQIDTQINLSQRNWDVMYDHCAFSTSTPTRLPLAPVNPSYGRCGRIQVYSYGVGVYTYEKKKAQMYSYRMLARASRLYYVYHHSKILLLAMCTEHQKHPHQAVASSACRELARAKLRRLRSACTWLPLAGCVAKHGKRSHGRPASNFFLNIPASNWSSNKGFI